ncbi:Uncharacterised protein [Vibrio cholerae]|nr:Uncharacterised protein [Vibrio cholerae]
MLSLTTWAIWVASTRAITVSNYTVSNAKSNTSTVQ